VLDCVVGHYDMSADTILCVYWQIQWARTVVGCRSTGGLHPQIGVANVYCVCVCVRMHVPNLYYDCLCTFTASNCA
jgi:hypothetical protein